MTRRYFVGIDPGVNGGVAVVDDRGRMLSAHRLASTPSALVEQFKGLPSPAVGLLEFVRSRPLMASASVFTFGRGYGRLEVALTAAGIPYRSVTPKSWQTFMECLSQGDKRVTKAKAMELFPAFAKVTHAVADAMLLAECCRRIEGRPRAASISIEED